MITICPEFCCLTRGVHSNHCRGDKRFLGGFIPAATIMGLPDGAGVGPRPQRRLAGRYKAQRDAHPVDGPKCRRAAGAIEAGAVVAGYAFVAARLHYRNVGYKQMMRLADDSAILTAAVIFLLAVASVLVFPISSSPSPR